MRRIGNIMVAVGLVILGLVSLGFIAYIIYHEFTSGNVIGAIAIIGLMLLIAGIILAWPTSSESKKWNEIMKEHYEDIYWRNRSDSLRSDSEK